MIYIILFNNRINNRSNFICRATDIKFAILFHTFRLQN